MTAASDALATFRVTPWFVRSLVLNRSVVLSSFYKHLCDVCVYDSSYNDQLAPGNVPPAFSHGTGYAIPVNRYLLNGTSSSHFVRYVSILGQQCKVH